MAPSSRTDGTANQRGDLWWSPHSGCFIWNQDKIADYEQGELEWSGEWVATDPIATVPGEGASNDSDYGIITPLKQLMSNHNCHHQGDCTNHDARWF